MKQIHRSSSAGTQQRAWWLKLMVGAAVSWLISRYIQDETDIIFHIRAYETRSVLLRNISPASMIRSLDKQLCLGLTGILQDIVRYAPTPRNNSKNNLYLWNNLSPSFPCNFSPMITRFYCLSWDTLWLDQIISPRHAVPVLCPCPHGGGHHQLPARTLHTNNLCLLQTEDGRNSHSWSPQPCFWSFKDNDEQQIVPDHGRAPDLGEGNTPRG